MFSDEVVIDVSNLSKRYEIYATPRDRLKQLVLPSLRKLVSRVSGLFGQSTPQPLPQYYREFWALDGVSFQVHRGETVGIVGLNGSGKSTLLQLICSTLAPTSGIVEVKGRVAALLELGSGFNPDYTGRENVFLNGQILGLSREEVQNRFQAIEEFADIGEFIDRPVKTYSNGMTVRLAFAVAINVEPEILVVDEALAVGDVGFQIRCFNKIDELQKRGTTLLFVSHSPSAITQLCSRAIVLHHGKLMVDGEAQESVHIYTRLCNGDNPAIESLSLKAVAADEDGRMGSENADTKVDGYQSEIRFPTPQCGAFLDQDLVNATTPKVAAADGVSISKFGLSWLSMEGSSSVNVVPQGGNVVLNFTVTFERPVPCCRFAWTLRSVQGVILGGGATHFAGEGSDYSEGSVEVSSQFENFFSPGEYIIDLFVRGGGVSNNSYLCAIKDAIIFRSWSGQKVWRNGLVNCLKNNGFSVRQAGGYCETFN